MKKLAIILSTLLLLTALILPVAALEPARGNIDEVFKDAYLHSTFDNTTGKDITKNHSVMPYGTCTHIGGQFGRGMNMHSPLNSLQIKKFGVGAGSFSFSGWFKVSYHDNLPMLFTNRDLSSLIGSEEFFGHDAIADIPGWSIYLDWSGNVVFSAKPAEGGVPFYCIFPTADYFPSTGMDTAKWHHLVVVVDKENCTVSAYVDNEQIGESESLPKSHADKSYDTEEERKGIMTIGDDISNDYQDTLLMTMHIDEIAAFKRALTEDEIAAIYDYIPEVPVLAEDWRPVTDDSGEWVIANPPVGAETQAPATEPVDNEQIPPETEAPETPAEPLPDDTAPADTEDADTTPADTEDAYGGGTADSENKSGLMVVDAVIVIYGLLCIVLLLCLFLLPKKKKQ